MICSPWYYLDGPWKHEHVCISSYHLSSSIIHSIPQFTLGLQDDGSVAFRNARYRNWIGPNICTSNETRLLAYSINDKQELFFVSSRFARSSLSAHLTTKVAFVKVIPSLVKHVMILVGVRYILW